MLQSIPEGLPRGEVVRVVVERVGVGAPFRSVRGLRKCQIAAFDERHARVEGSDQDAYSSSAQYTTWHTVVIEWTTTACRFILDGTTLGTSNRVSARIDDYGGS